MKIFTFKNKKLLNTYVSLFFAYLFLIYLLIIKSQKYFFCLNCPNYHYIIVFFLILIVSLSCQILIINAYFNKQRKSINFFFLYFLPLLLFYPYLCKLTIKSIFELLKYL